MTPQELLKSLNIPNEILGKAVSVEIDSNTLSLCVNGFEFARAKINNTNVYLFSADANRGDGKAFAHEVPIDSASIQVQRMFNLVLESVKNNFEEYIILGRL